MCVGGRVVVGWVGDLIIIWNWAHGMPFNHKKSYIHIYHTFENIEWWLFYFQSYYAFYNKKAKVKKSWSGVNWTLTKLLGAMCYHASQKLDPKFLWNSSFFCVSKLKVKYSFLLVNRKNFEDFPVSKLKVKIRISFAKQIKNIKFLFSYVVRSFTQFEGRQKSARNLLRFFTLGKLKSRIFELL